MTSRADLRAAFLHPNVQAFSRVVREGESSQAEVAYRMRYGGWYNGRHRPPVIFDDLSRHPRVMEPTQSGDKSSAAGAYQATWTTWNEEQKRWGWTDFSPNSQDEFFVARLIYRGALKAVMSGSFDEACRLCRAEWTSLPGGAEENDATKRARDTYLKWGGKFDGADVFNPDSLETEHYDGPEPYQYTPQEAKMAVPVPLILAGLQILKDLFPAVTTALKGDNVRERNVEIGTALLDAAMKATNAANEQEALERIQRDPDARAAAQAAIYQVLPTLVEVGGGIEAARRASAPLLGGDGEWWRFLVIPQFWITLMLLGLVYMAMGNITGIFGFQDWTPENRSNVLFLIVGSAIGAVTGFWFGTSMSSQKKDAALLTR